MPTAHLLSLGATSISRDGFATYLANYLDLPSGACWPERAQHA
jgi:leucyl/phenylalanyl-tRNA--protein transferase